MTSDTSHRALRVTRVHAQLLDLIEQRALGPGDKLPSEAELADEFGVSRPTLREALKLLDQDGAVTAVTGHGRYVTAARSVRVDRPITRYEGLTAMLTALGYNVTTHVISVDEAVADEDEARELGTAPGAPVLRLARIKYGDGRPLVYSESIVRRDELPADLSGWDWGGSLVAALAQAGHTIVASAASMTASQLPERATRIPQLAGLGPWLMVTESCVTEAGLRVLSSRDYHLGGAISFNVVRRL
ncbi:MAG: GntR family transcriptional regulator [Actinobacteria bacterium]|nr:GntR family transcriptional regulator [Actinomycetota bacterium]